MGKKDPLVAFFEGASAQQGQCALVAFSLLVLAMEDPKRQVAFQPMFVYASSAVLGVIFTIELLLKFKAYGPKAYVDNFWKANEVAIVVVWLIQFLVMFRTPTTYEDDTTQDIAYRGDSLFNAPPPLGFLKVLDCLQALRAVRLIGMIPVFRDIVHLLYACRDEMMSNLVMVVVICCFFSVLTNALFRGRLDYRCCTTDDFESGLCGNSSWSEGYSTEQRPGKLGPGTALPVCGGEYMCEGVVDYDVIVSTTKTNWSVFTNWTNSTNNKTSEVEVDYVDKEHEYDNGVCTEVFGGPNYGLFEYNSVSLAGYNVFTASLLTGVEKKIWWTMDGTYYHSMWVYFGILIINNLVLLNLFFGAIVLGYRAEKKARRMALEGSKNPELTDALDALNAMEASDDKELTEMFRGKEDNSTGPVEQVFDEKPPKPTCNESLIIAFKDEMSMWNVSVNILIIINFIVLLANPPGPVNSYSSNLIAFNFVFNLIFLLEASFRLCILGRTEFWKDYWNRFDLALGLLTTIDSIMQLANYNVSSSQGIHAVRLVRLMKLVRLFRITRLFRVGNPSALPHVGLRDLTALLGKTGTYLVYTFLMSWLLIYIFAIVGMRVFGGELHLDDTRDKTLAAKNASPFNFDTFAMAYYSCWYVVNMLSTDTIIDDVVHNGFTWFAFFVAMIFIVRCYVLSLIMAVLFDAQKDRAVECNCAHAKQIMISTYKLEFYLTKYVQYYFFKKWQKFCGASVSLGKPKVAEEPPPPPNFMQRFMDGPETLMVFQEKDWQRLAALSLTSPKSRIRAGFEVFMFALVTFSVWILTLGEESPESSMLEDLGLPTSLVWYFDAAVAFLLVLETFIRSVAYGFFPFQEGAVLRRGEWALDALIAVCSSLGLLDSTGDHFLHYLEFTRLLRICRFITPVKHVFSNKIIVALLDSLNHSAKTAITVFLFIVFWLFMFVAFGVEMFASRMNYCAVPDDAQMPYYDDLEGVTQEQCNFMATYVINRTTVCDANVTGLPSRYSVLDGFRSPNVGGHKFGYPVFPFRKGPFIGYQEFNYSGCYNSTYPEDLGLSDDACIRYANGQSGVCDAWKPFEGLEWFSPDMNFDSFSAAMVTMIRAFSFGAFSGAFFNVVDSKHWDEDGNSLSFVREQYPEGGAYFVFWGTMHHIATYVFIAGLYGVFYGTVLLPKRDGVVPSRKQASWETYATQLRWVVPLSFPAPPTIFIKRVLYDMVRSTKYRAAHSFVVALSFVTYYFYGSYGWHKGWDLYEEKGTWFYHVDMILTFLLLGEQGFRIFVYGLEDTFRSGDQQLSLFCSCGLAANLVANILLKDNGLMYGETFLTLCAYVLGGLRIFLIIPNSEKLMSATKLVFRSLYFMMPIVACLFFITYMFSCVGILFFKDTMGDDWSLSEELHGRESAEVVELRTRHFRNAFKTLGSTMQVLFLSTISDSMDSLFKNVDATLPRQCAWNRGEGGEQPQVDACGFVKWYVAPLFFGSYCIIIKFCALSIAKFVIVHIHEEGSIDLPDICMEQVNDFKEKWHDLDEYGLGTIKLYELSDFLAAVKAPLGLKDDSGAISPKFMNDRYALRILRQMYPKLKQDADAMAAAQEREARYRAKHGIAVGGAPADQERGGAPAAQVSDEDAKQGDESLEGEEPGIEMVDVLPTPPGHGLTGDPVVDFGFRTTFKEKRSKPFLQYSAREVEIDDLHHYPDLEDDFYEAFEVDFNDVLVAMHKVALFPETTRLDDHDQVEAERVHAQMVLDHCRLAIATKLNSEFGDKQFDKEGKRIGYRLIDKALMQRLRPAMYREQFMTNFKIEIERWKKSINTDGFFELERDEGRHLSNALKEELRTAEARLQIFHAIVKDPESDAAIFKPKMREVRNYKAELEKMVENVNYVRDKYQYRLWMPHTLERVYSKYTKDRGAVTKICTDRVGDLIICVSEGPHHVETDELGIPTVKSVSYVTVFGRNPKPKAQPDDDEDDPKKKFAKKEEEWKLFKLQPPIMQMNSRVKCCDCTEDGKVVVFGGDDSSVRVFSQIKQSAIDKRKNGKQVKFKQAGICHLKAVPNVVKMVNGYVVSACENGQLYIHSFRGGDALMTFSQKPLGPLFCLEILDLGFGANGTEEKGALHAIVGGAQGDLCSLPFQTNTKWFTTDTWKMSCHAKLAHGQTEAGPNSITSITSVGGGDEKQFVYTAGSEGGVIVWRYVQNSERDPKEPKDQKSNYLWIHKFHKVINMPVAHSGPVTDMLNANGTLTTVSDDMSVVVWKKHEWNPDADIEEEKFQQEVGFTGIFSDGEVKSVCANKFDLVVGDATGKLDIVQPGQYLTKYKFTANELPKGFKGLDRITSDLGTPAADAKEYFAKYGGPNQHGLFKLKGGFDFSRVWFCRGKKASPQYVPLSEFFDSVETDPEEQQLTTLGRVIVPIVWLWEVADIVATLVKPAIPFDLTLLGNDILPNLDNPEDAKDFDPNKKVATAKVVGLINGLLSYIDDYKREYFVTRSTEESEVKETTKGKHKYTLPHPRVEVTLKSEWLRTPAGLRARIPRFLVEGSANLGKMPRDVFTARVIANYSPRLNPLHGGVDAEAMKTAIYLCCHPVKHSRPMQCDGSKLQNLAPKHVNRLHRRASLDGGVEEAGEETDADTEDEGTEDAGGGGLCGLCGKKPPKSAVVEEAKEEIDPPASKGKTPEEIQAEEEALYDQAMAENEYKEVDDHEGADHAVTMTLTLADTTPELFTHNVQMAFKYDIAHGLNHGHGEEQQTYGHGIKPSQVEIVKFYAGSLHVETRVLHMRNENEGQELAAHMEALVTKGELLPKTYGLCSIKAGSILVHKHGHDTYEGEDEAKEAVDARFEEDEGKVSDVEGGGDEKAKEEQAETSEQGGGFFGWFGGGASKAEAVPTEEPDVRDAEGAATRFGGGSHPTDAGAASAAAAAAAGTAEGPSMGAVAGTAGAAGTAEDGDEGAADGDLTERNQKRMYKSKFVSAIPTREDEVEVKEEEEEEEEEEDGQEEVPPVPAASGSAPQKYTPVPYVNRKGEVVDPGTKSLNPLDKAAMEAAGEEVPEATTPEYLPAGTFVEAFRFEGKERYCPGTVVKSHYNGTYHIKFDDGVEEEGVPWELLKLHDHYELNEGKGEVEARKKVLLPLPMPKEYEQMDLPEDYGRFGGGTTKEYVPPLYPRRQPVPPPVGSGSAPKVETYEMPEPPKPEPPSMFTNPFGYDPGHDEARATYTQHDDVEVAHTGAEDPPARDGDVSAEPGGVWWSGDNGSSLQKQKSKPGIPSATPYTAKEDRIAHHAREKPAPAPLPPKLRGKGNVAYTRIRHKRHESETVKDDSQVDLADTCAPVVAAGAVAGAGVVTAGAGVASAAQPVIGAAQDAGAGVAAGASAVVDTAAEGAAVAGAGIAGVAVAGAGAAVGAAAMCEPTQGAEETKADESTTAPAPSNGGFSFFRGAEETKGEESDAPVTPAQPAATPAMAQAPGSGGFSFASFFNGDDTAVEEPPVPVEPSPLAAPLADQPVFAGASTEPEVDDFSGTAADPMDEVEGQVPSGLTDAQPDPVDLGTTAPAGPAGSADPPSVLDEAQTPAAAASTEEVEAAANVDAEEEAKAQDLHDYIDANAPMVVIPDDETSLTDEEEEFVKSLEGDAAAAAAWAMQEDSDEESDDEEGAIDVLRRRKLEKTGGEEECTIM